MNTFELQLSSPSQMLRIPDVVSFIGEDASGSFGLQAGHARFMTVLVFGLARYRSLDAGWQYLALPGALLDFSASGLLIATRRFLLQSDYQRISDLLQQQLRAEEAALSATKSSLRRMEEELLRRLWQLDNG